MLPKHTPDPKAQKDQAKLPGVVKPRPAKGDGQGPRKLEETVDPQKREAVVNSSQNFAEEIGRKL